MIAGQGVEFAPSHRELPQDATRIGAVNPADPITVSVYLKPKPQEMAPAPAGESPGELRNNLRAERIDAHKDDIQLIQDFAAEQGMTVESIFPARRLVQLRGNAEQMQQAFGTDLAQYKTAGGDEFRGRSGALTLPQNVADVVEAVLGLDNRPAADPKLKIDHGLASAVVVGHRPNQVAQLYHFPTSGNGAGQCIALLELGGGYLNSDNMTAFAAMGLPVPNVVAVSVDGGTNMPGGSADAEVALDIQVAGGAAPGARIAVYFAPNTFQGFVDAVSASVHDAANAPSVISISWGTAEDNWTVQARQAMNNALQDAANLGVSVFVAAGDHLGTDNLANGKANVDFPAGSPFAIGCGGTLIDTTGNVINSETVWNEGANGWGTGGGISDFAAPPAFQAAANLPPSVNDGGHRRGVPDVAGNAASASGYSTVIHGVTQTVGGTSAVAPLWAGLTALLNQGAAHPIGFFLPTLYANPGLLRDITQGNNKPVGSNLGYDAGPGWDACTGLGVPDGGKLYAFFASWPGGHLMNNVDSTSATPGLAAFNGKLHMLWRANDASNRLYSSTSSDGGASWPNGATIDDVDSSAAAPAVCAFNGKLYAAFRANDPSAKIYVAASIDGTSWPHAAPINTVDSTPQAPSCCVFDNKLYLFWKANDPSNAIYMSVSSDGTSWSNGKRINTSDSTPFTPMPCVFANKLYLFWRANDASNTLYFSASADGVSWPGGARINSFDSSTDAPAAAVIGSRLALVFKANDPSNMMYCTMSSDGLSWPAAQRINQIDSTPVRPGLCAIDGTLVIAWKANDPSNRIYLSARTM